MMMEEFMHSICPLDLTTDVLDLTTETLDLTMDFILIDPSGKICGK